MAATRRNFFSWTRNALAASGLVGVKPEAAEAAVAAGEDYYAKLGVTKIINAAGTYTALTASTMPPQVRAAVTEAAKHPVRLAELQQKAGQYLASRLKCEAALVSAGAASALTLGTAACMTVGNQKAVSMLPLETAGLKNEVIVQKTHRYGYDHAIKNCGIKFVEVETLDEYEKAFTDHTVMCHFFNAAEGGQIGREKWIEVAHRHASRGPQRESGCRARAHQCRLAFQPLGKIFAGSALQFRQPDGILGRLRHGSLDGWRHDRSRQRSVGAGGIDDLGDAEFCIVIRGRRRRGFRGKGCRAHQAACGQGVAGPREKTAACGGHFSLRLGMRCHVSSPASLAPCPAAGRSRRPSAICQPSRTVTPTAISLARRNMEAARPISGERPNRGMRAA